MRLLVILVSLLLALALPVAGGHSFEMSVEVPVMVQVETVEHTAWIRRYDNDGRFWLERIDYEVKVEVS